MLSWAVTAPGNQLQDLLEDGRGWDAGDQQTFDDTAYMKYSAVLLALEKKICISILQRLFLCFQLYNEHPSLDKTSLTVQHMRQKWTEAEFSERPYLFHLKTVKNHTLWAKSLWQNNLNKHQPSQYMIFFPIRNLNILHISEENIPTFKKNLKIAMWEVWFLE